MPAIVKNADYATFINVFKCKPRDQHEVVRINAEIIEVRPGRTTESNKGTLSQWVAWYVEDA